MSSVQSIEGNEQEIRAAEEDCQQLLDAAEGDDVVGQQQAGRLEQMLAYAECIREQGFDMPDPVVDDDGRAEMQMPGRVNRQEFQATLAECVAACVEFE